MNTKIKIFKKKFQSLKELFFLNGSLASLQSNFEQKS